MPRIAFVLPTYKAFAYARKTAQSFFENTPLELDPICIVVDDASHGPEGSDPFAWIAELPTDRVHLHRFDQQDGLTRSWNFGLSKASELGATHAIAGNSDLLFSPGWADGMLEALDDGWDLVGPLSNAAGISWDGDDPLSSTRVSSQFVQQWYTGYCLSDYPYMLAETARYLAQKYAGQVVPMRINGFFMMAKAEKWRSGSFDSEHVFDPGNKLTDNDYELVARWLRQGRKLGCVLSSFIFHYRSASRQCPVGNEGSYRMVEE